jgi:hypothetical protein
MNLQNNFENHLQGRVGASDAPINDFLVNSGNSINSDNIENHIKK